MGAGAVKAQGSQSRESTGSSSDSSQLYSSVPASQGSNNETNMSCDSCSIPFTIFKRKKTCVECSHYYCSTCLPKEPGYKSGTGRTCTKCRMLLSGNFTRHDLVDYKVRDLKDFLSRKKVQVSSCKEKNDLVDLILRFSNSSQYLRDQAEHERHFQQLQERQEQMRADSVIGHPTNYAFNPDMSSEDAAPPDSANPPPSNSHPTEDRPSEPAQTESTANAQAESDTERQERLLQRQQREMTEAEDRLRDELHRNDSPELRPPKQRLTIQDIKSEEHIEGLNVKQLKEVLANNFVDYKGCVEKWELVDRTKRLWENYRNNKEKEQCGLASEEEVCTICFDKLIDAVLLECGHMATCTDCGKRISECPLCRQYVTRVVHVFKA